MPIYQNVMLCVGVYWNWCLCFGGHQQWLIQSFYSSVLFFLFLGLSLEQLAPCLFQSMLKHFCKVPLLLFFQSRVVKVCFLICGWFHLLEVKKLVSYNSGIMIYWPLVSPKIIRSHSCYSSWFLFLFCMFVYITNPPIFRKKNCNFVWCAY